VESAAPVAEIKNFERPLWMTMTRWSCEAVLVYCAVAVIASIDEIFETRTQPPGPFAPNFASSWFGNRAMEREVIEMTFLALPFAAAVRFFHHKRHRRVRDVE
jgi:hypothetical protein